MFHSWKRLNTEWLVTCDSVANRETLRNSRYSDNQSQETVLGKRTIWIPILILTKTSTSLVVTRRNRVNPLEKRCQDLKLLRYLIRTSLRNEKYRSFLFSRLDLLNRTDPDEVVRNVEYDVFCIMVIVFFFYLSKIIPASESKTHCKCWTTMCGSEPRLGISRITPSLQKKNRGKQLFLLSRYPVKNFCHTSRCSIRYGRSSVISSFSQQHGIHNGSSVVFFVT
jgi:hypothetical protein